MNLIDTHAHLYYERFEEDFDEVIHRAVESGLTRIINIGADIESSKKAAKLENDQIKFYSSIGLHPHEISRLSNDVSIHQNIGELERLYQTNTTKVVAIGECGLDYHFEGLDFSPTTLSQDQQITLQKELFQAQIDLAKKLKLPLIIHSRDAWEDIFFPTLQSTQGVFHSFTGSENEAKKALSLGYYLGFSCIVTYPKNEHLRQIIKNMPLNKILIETDCPYLPPQSQRGQRNEPANVSEVVKVISEIKGISFKEAAQTTFDNAQRLFKLY